MAKKKSKDFIIPAIHFINAQVAKKPKEKKVADAIPQKEPTVSPPIAAQKKTPTQEIKEPPTIENKRLSKGERPRSALSLSSLKKNKIEEAQFKKKTVSEDSLEDLPKDPFTEERFFEVWDQYIDDLNKKGEKILGAILKADRPVLKGEIIHVTYPNKLMKAELLKVRPKVLRHIRGQLNNFSVDFEVHVNEENTTRFAYTPQEKYERLKEKNEHIALLRKTFNLEL